MKTITVAGKGHRGDFVLNAEQIRVLDRPTLLQVRVCWVGLPFSDNVVFSLPTEEEAQRLYENIAKAMRGEAAES